jgi:hypothetical protein
LEDTLKQVEHLTTNKSKCSQEQQEILDTTIHIPFPRYKQINTIYHLQKYAPEHIQHIHKKYVRELLILEQLPTDLHVPDIVLLLLYAGIGIYSNDKFDSQYYELVLQLASQGKLAFLIADMSICYGTNYPISNLIIDASIQRSIDTIFQLMGRCGRIGQSWSASIHIDDDIYNQLSNYFTIKTQQHTLEAIHLTNCLHIFTNALNKSEPISQSISTDSTKLIFVKNNYKDTSTIDQEPVEERKEKDIVKDIPTSSAHKQERFLKLCVDSVSQYMDNIKQEQEKQEHKNVYRPPTSKFQARDSNFSHKIADFRTNDTPVDSRYSERKIDSSQSDNMFTAKSQTPISHTKLDYKPNAFGSRYSTKISDFRTNDKSNDNKDSTDCQSVDNKSNQKSPIYNTFERSIFGSSKQR